MGKKKCIIVTEEINIKNCLHQESNPGTLSPETYAFPYDHHVAQ